MAPLPQLMQSMFSNPALLANPTAISQLVQQFTQSQVATPVSQLQVATPVSQLQVATPVSQLQVATPITTNNANNNNSESRKSVGM
jgi:hypothetical protein